MIGRSDQCLAGCRRSRPGSPPRPGRAVGRSARPGCGTRGASLSGGSDTDRTGYRTLQRSLPFQTSLSDLNLATWPGKEIALKPQVQGFKPGNFSARYCGMIGLSDAMP
eukprot:750405-Hanusia_phi.AAC.1